MVPRISMIMNHSTLQVESKTKIQSWLTVLLSVAATMFICESVQSQDQYRGLDAQRGAVLGNSSNGNGSNQSSGRSAEDRNEDAARQTNHQGNVSFDNGDYQGALRYYQEAYAREHLESNRKIDRKNIALAQAAIFDQQAGEAWKSHDYREALRLYQEHQKLNDGPNVRNAIAQAKAWVAWSEGTTAADLRRAIAMQPGAFPQEAIRHVEELEASEKSQRDQRAAAKNIHQSIHTLAQTLNAAPSSGQGAFGTTVSHPNDLVFGDPNAVAGTEKDKAGDQLKSADYHGEKAVEPRSAENARWEAGQVFDSSRGGYHGSLATITKDGGNPTHDPVIPGPFIKDAAIVAATTKRDEDKKTLADAEAELKTLEQSHPEDQVKIENAKQKSSTALIQVWYDNFAIGDRLKALSRGSPSTTAK